MSAQLKNLIIKFAKSLPDWQKILAKRALEYEPNIDLDNAAIRIALIHVYKQLSITTSQEALMDDVTYINSLSEVTGGNTEYVPVKLKSIDSIQGVNALSKDQKITIAPKLTIIYGDNGTGKSGYSRLMNNAFYSRGDKELLPNILLPSAEQKTATAKFVFQNNGTDVEVLYPKEKDKTEFSSFACFDSKTVEAHLVKENELFVVPVEMKFYTRLSDLTIQFKKALTSEMAKIDASKKFLEKFEGNSELKTSLDQCDTLKVLLSLKPKDVIDDSFLELIAQEEQNFNKLKLTDPKTKADVLRKAKVELETLKIYLTKSQSVFGEAKLTSIDETYKKLLKAEDDSRKYGASSFKNDFFEIVDSQKWKDFITSSVNFIKTEKDIIVYPKAGEACPLCFQQLQEESITLFKRYFTFLETENESIIKQMKGIIAKYEGEVIAFPTKDFLDFPNLSSSLDFENDVFAKRLKSITLGIIENRNDLIKKLKLNNVSDVKNIEFENIETACREIVVILDSKISSFDETKFKASLKLAQDNYVALVHKRTFIENYGDIETFFLRSENKAKVLKEEGRITTKPITDAQKVVFEDYFTKQYRQKFFQEASTLKINFNIDVKGKGSQGKTSRKLDVLNYSPSKILSEGEQRAIAIADFLTEAEICNISGGLVFDDPVNSLDHERKEHISKRLVQESHKRQIIIFTHDITFLYDLINEANRHGMKEKSDFFCHWIKKSGSSVGVIDLNLKKRMEKDYLEPIRALEKLSQAKGASDPQDVEDYCRQGFDCLRQTYEAFVLYELFAETVIRFDKQIKHKTISEVFCPPDIGKRVSEALEKCSGHVDAHLKADSYRSTDATPETLEDSIKEFQNLKVEFKKRKKEAA